MAFYTFPDQLLFNSSFLNILRMSSISLNEDVWFDAGSFGSTLVQKRLLGPTGPDASMYEVVQVDTTGGPTPVGTQSFFTEDTLGATLAFYSKTIFAVDRDDYATYAITNNTAAGEYNSGVFTPLDLVSRSYFYSTFYFMHDVSDIPSIATYPQPTDSLIMFPSPGSTFDAYTNYSAWEIVRSVIGSVPFLSTEVDLRNTLPYYDSMTNSYNLNGHTLIFGGTVTTDNNGEFTMDAADNLIYQWTKPTIPTNPSFNPPNVPNILQRKKPTPIEVIRSLRPKLALKDNPIL